MPAARAHDQPGQEPQRVAPSPAAAGGGPPDLGRQAIECIRQAIWQMRTTEDIHAVLQVMRTQLHQQVVTTDRKIRDFYAGSTEQVAGNQPAVLQDEDIPV